MHQLPRRSRLSSKTAFPRTWASGLVQDQQSIACPAGSGVGSRLGVQGSNGSATLEGPGSQTKCLPETPTAQLRQPLITMLIFTLNINQAFVYVFYVLCVYSRIFNCRQKVTYSLFIPNKACMAIWKGWHLSFFPTLAKLYPTHCESMKQNHRAQRN